MDQTITFIFLTLIMTLVCFTFIVWPHSIAISIKLAKSFYFLCLFLALLGMTATILSVTGLLPFKGTLAVIFQIIIFRGWIVIGIAISSAILLLLNLTHAHGSRLANGSVRSFISSPDVLRGLCLSVSVAFLMTEIGKLAHDAEMRQFFLESGYSVWFLYFVITMETLGSIALFIPKLIVPAALGLIILMFGAIATHFRNGDPFSDSLEALHLLIVLICIVVIKSLKNKMDSAYKVADTIH
jgi:uncharacterized membrane protein YphA (DoxX/SURF4 family)